MKYTYNCIKTKDKIKIDGKLNEKIWGKLKPVGPFQFPWAKKVDLKQKTVAKLTWDDKYLYLGYLAYDKDIQAIKRGRKGNVWLDDVVEIFLAPTLNDKSYFGFELNALGDLLDYKAKVYRKFNYKWIAKGIKTATFIKKGKFFSAEFAIPFSAIKKYPKNETIWNIGLFRVDYNIVHCIKKDEYSLWKPSGTKTPDYHRLKAFGKLAFKDTCK
ncbi:MAG: carbohydrate-binding family 9-like protein [Candidatus Firestonebacteria bacterium]